MEIEENEELQTDPLCILENLVSSKLTKKLITIKCFYKLIIMF